MDIDIHFLGLVSARKFYRGHIDRTDANCYISWVILFERNNNLFHLHSLFNINICLICYLINYNYHLTEFLFGRPRQLMCCVCI